MVTPQRIHGIDVALVKAAICRAERLTSGEIRVAVARYYFWGKVDRAAQHAFKRLRIAHTRQRNGVLIFVAPRRRELAVIGDVGINERVPAAFWRELVDTVGAHSKKGELTAGLVDAVARVGTILAEIFPPLPGVNVNELPDTVVALP